MLYGGGVNAQVGIGTTSPNASAVLDLTSTTQGLLPPRMTQAQRNAIATPATGLMVWCTNCGTAGELQVNNGTTWTNMVGATASGIVPSAPTNIVATAGNAQASVAFTAPASTGGSAITGYTVTSSPGNFTATGASSPLVVTGLTNGTAYTFTVVATNAAGNSSASSPSGAVTPNAPTANAGAALSAICQSGTAAAMGGSVGGSATGGTWTGGAGTWTNANNPSTATYTAGASESGSITLTLTTIGGSFGTTTATKSITVNANPTISGTTPASRCGTGTVALGATASAGTINWYAASSGGSSLGTGTSFTTPSIAATTMYYVDATNSGCTTASRTAVTATVNANPTANAGAALAAINQGATSAAMGGSVGGSATGGTWTGGAGTWTNATNASTATYTAGASETGSITLTLTTSVGSCGTTTATKTITVNAASGCGNVTFTYNGASVTYGTVTGANSTCWLDRNLGATRVAQSSTDHLAYGDLFQWGRGADGHQLITWTDATTGTAVNGTTATLSSTDSPGNALFITINDGNNDWRSPQNVNLWQEVSGTNNPCPNGYRLPTETELEAERASWGANNNAAGAFASPLKLPVSAGRNRSNGTLVVGTNGNYWSSTVSDTNSRNLFFNSIAANMNTRNRAIGYAVRCLKD